MTADHGLRRGIERRSVAYAAHVSGVEIGATRPSDADIRAVCERLLARPLTTEELVHLRGASSIAQILDAVLTSDEWAPRVRAMYLADRPEPHPNVWVDELAPFAIPPGTISADGTAEVGRDGYLFLRSGSNMNRGQHEGRFIPNAEWGPRWQNVYAARTALAAEAGIDLLWMIVPDKMAWAPHLLSPPLQPGRSPRRMLIEDFEVPFECPVELLQALPDAYLRTDSHLTLRGNHALANWVLAHVDAPPLAPFEEFEVAERFTVGDLGKSFDPALAERCAYLTDRPFDVVLDNRNTIDKDRHIGTHLIMRNEDSPDARTAVVFGDSYACPFPEYQGLSWWLALVFRETHFVWLPFGWAQEFVERARPDVVIIEGSERFSVKVPEVDSPSSA